MKKYVFSIEIIKWVAACLMLVGTFLRFGFNHYSIIGVVLFLIFISWELYFYSHNKDTKEGEQKN